MTVREQLAKAFPLHFQRIAEATYADMGICFTDGFLDKPATSHAKVELASAFVWRDTSEGHDYWHALAVGAAS